MATHQNKMIMGLGPLDNPNEMKYIVVTNMNKTMTIIFTVELLVKCVAWGAIFGDNAYTSSGWHGRPPATHGVSTDLDAGGGLMNSYVSCAFSFRTFSRCIKGCVR